MKHNWDCDSLALALAKHMAPERERARKLRLPVETVDAVECRYPFEEPRT